jgi:cytochrome b561
LEEEMALALKSTSDRYGTVAVLVHWVTALLILILIGSGFSAANAADSAAKLAILKVHVPLAFGVLAVMILRVVWWLGFDQKPIPPVGSPLWQERTTRAVHVLFYAVIVAMVASGVGMLALSGAAPIIFRGEPALLPDFWKYPPRLPHGVGVWVLLALLVLHACAALYHQFVRRDDLLWRMWFSSRRHVGHRG